MLETKRKKDTNIVVSEPELPRQRKPPAKLDEDLSRGYYPQSVEAHYRRYYFESLDLAINSIKSWFDQPGYRTYKNLESVLLNSVSGKDCELQYEEVRALYGEDVDVSALRVQLETLATKFQRGSIQCETVHDFVQAVRSPSKGEKALLGEVCTVVKLILVNTSTNAISVHSFSAMRRVKNYLRSTVSCV